MSNPPIVGLVPARIGSKRIRGKNFKKLSGHSLVYWAVRSAVESGVFEDVVISTDHTGYITQDILDIGGHGFHRPKEYATDTSPDVEWIRHAMTETFCKQYPSFAILRPTSPFRTAAMIRRAYAEFCDAGRAIDSLRAVERVSQHPGKMWTLQRDTRPYRLMPLLPQPEYPWHSSQMAALPEVWVQNASMEIAWINTIERYGNQAGEVVAPFFTKGHEGFDINDDYDWKAAEMLVAEDPDLLPSIRTSQNKIGLLPRTAGEQASLEAMEAAWRHGQLLPNSTSGRSLWLLLMALARYSPDGRFTDPSQKRLARDLGVSPTWVSKLVGKLVDQGCISVAGLPAPRRNTRYELHIHDTEHHRMDPSSTIDPPSDWQGDSDGPA